MTSANLPERRRYTRVNFNAAVTMSQNNKAFESNIVDVSLNGILVDTPQDYEMRTDIPVEACIKLTDDTEIRMNVSLIHSSSSVLGFKSNSIDVDSIAHLRRLVELNIDDPNASERVLSELVGPES
jgi:hypothetical protein